MALPVTQCPLLSTNHIHPTNLDSILALTPPIKHEEPLSYTNNGYPGCRV